MDTAPPLLSPENVVVVTGAEGRVGSAFRDEYLRSYRDAYRLRLAVWDGAFADERFPDTSVFDLADISSVERALHGSRAVLHLAAEPNHDAGMDSLAGPNLAGAYNLFESARHSGCERVVFASSIHAVLGRPSAYQAHANEGARPDCLYGATKVFGEALCSVYAHQHGMSCIAVRIGAFVPTYEIERWVVTDRDFLSMAVTQVDLCQLLHRCLVAPRSVRYAVVQGVSNNRYRWMEIESARELVGYQPLDDVFRIAEAGTGA
jgi:uronate dehydrogenase